MLARTLISACCALIASTATTSWAEQPNPKPATPNTNQSAADGWAPIFGFGVVGGYGQLPGPAIGWMFSGGFRTPSFSIALEGRTLYDFIVEDPKAPNIFLRADTIAFPLCIHGRRLYGCLVAEIESIKNNVWPFGIPLHHYKWSNKLGIAIRSGYDSPPIQKLFGIPTHLRPFVQLGIYSSPRRIEINDNVLWESGSVHFTLGCTYGF